MKIFPQILLGILILAVGIAGTVFLIGQQKAPETQSIIIEPPVIRTFKIEPKNTTITVSAYGTVMAKTEITLSSQVTGKVIQVYPNFLPGGKFKKGDILFKIDPRDYEAAVHNAKAQLSRAEMLYEMEKIESQIAKKEWESIEKTHAPSLALRKPQLAEAKAAWQSAKAALVVAELNLERTSIKAPFNGRVKQKLIGLGQLVSAGTPAGTIYATDYAEIRVPLPLDQFKYLGLPLDYHEDIHNIKTSKVTLKADLDGQEQKWPAYLVRTEAQIDPQSRMIYAVVRVNKPYKQDPPLPIGLFVKAEIEGESLKNIVIIPRSSIRGTNQVLIVNGQGKLHFKTVDIYWAGRKNVILKKGLNKDDVICLTPLDTVVDGMKVKIFNDK